MGKTFRRKKSHWDDDIVEKNQTRKKRKTLREFRKGRKEKLTHEKSVYNRER